MSGTVWNRVRSHFGSLYRDRENGLLLGVCAGLARRYRVNPLAVRIGAAVALLALPAATAIAYLVLGLTLRDVPLTYSGSRAERDFWRRHDAGTERRFADSEVHR